MIEEYLKDRFGEYADYIKKWIAAYYFTDNIKLPGLAIGGLPENGKSTFAKFIFSIKPESSMHVEATTPFKEIENISPKFVVIEDHNNPIEVYKKLKSFAGSQLSHLNWCVLYQDKFLSHNDKEDVLGREDLNPYFIYEPKPLKQLDSDILSKLKEDFKPWCNKYLRDIASDLIPAWSVNRYLLKTPFTGF